MEAKTVWLISLALALAVALYPIFLGNFYSTGDMRDVFIPLERFFQSEQMAGRLPVWNPDIAWGYPTLASAQIGFYYPPLFLLRFLPLTIYMPVLLSSHLLFLALGSFYFFRRQNITPASAYLGAISFTLGSFIWQHLTHLNIIIAIAWFPWQLLAVQYLLAKSKLARPALVLALALALPFLAGQLHLPTLMALVSASYFLYLLFLHTSPRPTRTYVFYFQLAVVLAIGLSAAQLLPTGELLLNSSRGTSNGFAIERANQHSFPLYHLPTTLFPRFFGNDHTYWGKRLQVEYGIFIGSLPFLLSLWALKRSRVKLKATASQLTYFKWLLLLSFLLALGSLSPFRLLGLEPSLWVFSAPARWLLFTNFALAYFAAQGFSIAHNLPHKISVRFRQFALTLAIGIVVYTLVIFTIPQNALSTLLPASDYYQEKLASILLSARASSFSLASPYTALSLISVIAFPYLMIRRRGKLISLLVITLELIIIAATTNATLPWSIINEAPDSLSRIPNSVHTGQARLMSIQRPGDTGAFLTNPSTRADANIRREQHELLIPLHHLEARLPGTQWPASLDLAGHAEFLDQLHAGPNLALAAQSNIGALLIYQPEKVLEIQVVELAPAPRAQLGHGHALYEQISPRQAKIYVNTAHDDTLLVSNSFYPGWHAYLDERPIDISRGQKIFQRINVPAGEHTIDLIYRPTLVYVGLALSLVTLFFCVILALEFKTT